MNPLVTESVSVNIYGREYEVDPGGLTPLEASQLAAYVDSKMREIADKLHLVDTQKIAVLAALNIAFELSHHPANSQNLGPDDEKKIEELNVLLEKCLATKAG